MVEVECCECKKTEPETRLRKCPICFKHYCDDHAHQRSGVSFCSSGCAEYFFFADPDE